MDLNKLIKGVTKPRAAGGQIYREHIQKIIKDYHSAATSRYPVGTNVFEKEWDALILLDTCRVDALRAVSPEYDFLETVERIWSVGGATAEWVSKTFDKNTVSESEIANTCYLTANPWPSYILDDDTRPNNNINKNKSFYRINNYGDCNVASSDELDCLLPVWELHDLHETYSVPRYLTDTAIDIGRNHDASRTIIHYKHPHPPYVKEAFEEERDLLAPERSPYTYIIRTGDRSTVWDLYLKELRWVLDDVELLLENMDAEKVVISADHGVSFGDYGLYSQSAGSINPVVRYVPWVETSGTDTGNHEPEYRFTDEILQTDQPSSQVEDQLSHLGYID